MQELIAKEIKAEEDSVSYEIQWIIPNWRQVRQDVSLMRNQKATFETGHQPSEMIQTKWLVGLKDVPSFEALYNPIARVYWQLLDLKGSESKLEVQFESQLYSSEGRPEWIEEVTAEVSLGELVDQDLLTREITRLGPNVRVEGDDSFINPNGAVQYTLILTIKKPIVDASRFKKFKMEIFSKRSHYQLRENLARLLNEDSDGDLKIITSDGIELSAYQRILKAQCPVIAGMLNSGLSESKTGVMKVDDISGKTMKILLHYFYTGDLLDGWSDHDTVLEFTYAAGKYQMTQVMDLLDDVLGRSDEDDVSNLDVQLLNLAGKLSLKNAETRLLKGIISKVGSAKSSEDLFRLFGCDSEELYTKADMLAVEQIESSKIFEILDYIFGNANQQVDFSHRGLILLAFVRKNGSLKAFEQILLKQIVEIASTFKTAEELFAFIGDGK